MSLHRIFSFLLLLLVLCLTSAQTVVPTTDDSGSDPINKGSTSAQLNQEIQLILPQATALHMDVGTLAFDLSALDGDNWPHSGGSPLADEETIYCAEGLQPQDDVQAPNNNFFTQSQTLPLGTHYGISTDTWPNITVKAGAEILAYPPIRLDEKGELVPSSKNFFVCYKSFILQKFSNFPYWKLTVTRTDDPQADQAIQTVYIQDNPCHDPGTTGLFLVEHNKPIDLLTRSIVNNKGTTGQAVLDAGDTIAEQCRYKGWLDDLIVVAVKVAAESHGTNRATLQFTLTSQDTTF